MVGPTLAKFGSKKQYQRILHESYQFLVKFIADQQAMETCRRKKRDQADAAMAALAAASKHE